MTYNHDRIPWKIAHKTDLLSDHEIQTAIAPPRLIPELINVERKNIFSSYGKSD